jgi:hypothetical protein
MTIGEKRVGVEFNPSNIDLVSRIKQDTARLIDCCAEMKVTQSAVARYEKIRLCELAEAAYEEAAMWAVKAATSP